MQTANWQPGLVRPLRRDTDCANAAATAIGVLALVSAGWCCVCGVATASGQTYDIAVLAGEDSVRSQAYGINATGQTVGWSVAGDTTHATHWHNDLITDLHGTVHFWLEHPYDGDYSEAFDISDSNQVVGGSIRYYKCLDGNIPHFHAFVMRPAVLSDLATPYPGDALTDLGTFGAPCVAWDSATVGISNRSHAVGWADVDDRGTVRAFLVTPQNGVWYVDANADYVNDLMVNLGVLHVDTTVSSATAVNDTGIVTGYSYILPPAQSTAYHAFVVVPVDTDLDGVNDLWARDANADGVNDLMADVGTLGGNNSWGRDINNLGQIAGESDTDDGNVHAFVVTPLDTNSDGTPDLWFSDLDGDGANDLMTDLGTLGGANSSASRLNDSGHIVGWAENSDGERRACRWVNGTITDLNAVLNHTTTVLLTEARDINARGQIAGWGVSRAGTSDDKRAFILTEAEAETDAGGSADTGGGGDSGGSGGTSSHIDGADDLAPVPEPGTTQTDQGTGGESGSGTTPTATPALCGFGTLAVLPFTLLGLVCAKIGARLRRP